MATATNVVKFKRSAVADKIPATTDLALGELALNTNDGRIYLKKSVASVESIVTLEQLPTNLRGYTFPATRGTFGQSLTTNGDGTLSWRTVSAGEGGGTTFNDNGTFSLPLLTAEPADLQLGQIALADGIQWDPLTQSTGKPYLVLYTGTSWMALGGSSGGVTMDEVYNAILEVG